MRRFAANLEARKRDQQGFTLIELIIVIAIIGILVAIAIPVYGAVQKRAKINALQESARSGYTSMLATFSQEGESVMIQAMDDYNNERFAAGDDDIIVGWAAEPRPEQDSMCVIAYWLSGGEVDYDIEPQYAGTDCPSS